MPDARRLHGAGRIAVHVEDKAEERIPMVRHVEPCEAGFEDRERRVVDVVRIEGAVDCKPSRSLEQTVGDIVKSYARPCGNHG